MPETETVGSQSLCLSRVRGWSLSAPALKGWLLKITACVPHKWRGRAFEKSLFHCCTAGLHSVVLIALPTPDLACALRCACHWRPCLQPQEPKVEWCLSLRVAGVIGEFNCTWSSYLQGLGPDIWSTTPASYLSQYITFAWFGDEDGQAGNYGGLIA